MNLNCEFLEKYPLYSLINVLDYYFYKLHEDFSWLLKKQRIKDCELLEIVNQNQLKYYIFQKNKFISPDFLPLHFSLIPSSSISHDKTS